jgi:hypothetical protein
VQRTQRARVEREKSRGEKSRGEKNTDAPNGAPVSDSHPFALFEALCDVQGHDPSDITERQKSRQLAVAKRLIADGVNPDDVARLTRYLLTQAWRTSGIDLFTIEKEIGAWQIAGKPEKAIPGSLTRLNGGLADDDPNIDPSTGKPWAYNHPKNPRSMVG